MAWWSRSDQLDLDLAGVRLDLGLAHGEGGEELISRYRINDIGKIRMWGHRHWGGMRRGWLRPWIISIVGRSPKNGAEIIDEIERMSWGGWRPSPGSIYPLLDQMTVEGSLKKLDDGRYELTEKGKDEGSFPFGFPFGQRPTSVDSMVSEMRDYVSYFEDIARSSASKLDPYKERLREVAGRLSKLL